MAGVGHFFRHQLLEILNHAKFWIIGGIVFVFARATPEDLIAKFIEHIPEVFRSHWPTFLDFRTTLTILAVLIVVGDVVQRRLRDSRIRKLKEQAERAQKIKAELRVEQREDVHVANVVLSAQNIGNKPERITRLEFVTKGHWDIPSWNWHTQTKPVIGCLTGKSYITISTDWPAPGSADTELGVLMEPEVRHGETEVYTRV